MAFEMQKKTDKVLCRYTLYRQTNFKNVLKLFESLELIEYYNYKKRHLAIKFETNFAHLSSTKSKDGDETASPSGDGVCNCLCKPVLSVLPLLVDVSSVCTLN